MRLRYLILVPLATVALYACGHDAERPAGYDDVVYAGDVTDEALVALVSALEQGAPATAPTRAPTLDAPSDGATISAGSSSAFSWHVGASASLRERSMEREAESWPALSPAPRSQPTGFSSALGALGELLGPPRRAWAHGEPFTGTATYLVFSTDSNPKLLRVLTSGTTYTPDKPAWDKLAAAGGPIKLTLTGAEFENNRILQDGGPFAGSSIQITVTP
jgi:hypothetical protein